MEDAVVYHVQNDAVRRWRYVEKCRLTVVGPEINILQRMKSEISFTDVEP